MDITPLVKYWNAGGIFLNTLATIVFQLLRH